LGFTDSSRMLSARSIAFKHVPPMHIPLDSHTPHRVFCTPRQIMEDRGMAEQKSVKGWFKTLFGTVLGLATGAATMYISPLVNGVIKPGRPLANFAVETDGMTATFHNRYSGEGWW